ncbi:hypothetical protein SAMN04489796_1045 [Winogradskyella thalassocola]|uniref:Uncharacterized protein n=2 Tax=Winogradskyella thalassocola TaxID=262004 RepID=A0A1G8EQ70_9FLAO|nr:hypothetical protein SAMN04489796_1045 [Winogradskyella thalassocola]
MIKFFRKIRYNLMEKNKTGKYFKYAIGEIVLVVIGILIALSINNWNQKRIEKKQIRNIYIRIVQDLNNTASEIESDIKNMDIIYPLMQNILNGDIERDSLLSSNDYFRKYHFTLGSPDIQINETGMRLLESKIELDYELNTELTEALSKLYSEKLFELEVDAKFVGDNLERLTNHIVEEGVLVDYLVKNDRTKYVNMIFEDVTYKNYFHIFSVSYDIYKNSLIEFKADGEVLIDRIKAEYNLE